MISVRIHVTAKKGKQLELKQAITFLKNRIDREMGCTSYRVYQSTDTKDEFVIIEEWENEELAQAHLKSENLTVLAGAASILTKEVRVSLGEDSVSKKLTELFKK
jgi:quinol monooxygenase YgiN